MRFYLGTDRPNWIGKVDVPLFVSTRVLRDRKKLTRATGPVAIDSGAFTEISTHGAWQTSEAAYLDAVARYVEEIGIDWAAPMDWMCEPWILERTGLTVEEHQHRTVDSFCRLRSSSSAVIPVLQGWTMGDYLRCISFYEAAGVDLTAEPTVGLGSVCRRSDTEGIVNLVVELEAAGLRLHGFGVKSAGLREIGWALTSADSMAWSYQGRRNPPLPGCTHRSCSHCLRFALAWRLRLLSHLDYQQPPMFGAVA